MRYLILSQPNNTKLGRFSYLPEWAAILLTIVIVAVIFLPVAHAQSTQGFTGTVADQTGAVLPKAKVTVHNQATQVDKVVTTTSAGSYSVPFLDPGIYTVTAEAAGFKVANKTDITLQTAQLGTVNFKLTAGSVTESVTVNASEDVLDYSKADRGDVVERERIMELPILANEPFNLDTLSAGALNTLNPVDYAPFNQVSQSVSIHDEAIEINIDGLSDLSMTGAQNYAYVPSKDSIGEFKLTTNAYDASAGRSPGGAIDATLKTGTSRLHGDVYESMRRGFLDANTESNDAHAVNGLLPNVDRVPPHHQDQYGAEVDGPVIIPHLWGGRKKTFFLTQIEWWTELKGGSAVTESVPEPAWIGLGSQYPGAGDFSDFLSANITGGAKAIYDPSTEAACTANNTSTNDLGHCRYQFGYGPGAAKGPNGNPTPTGAPINVIPASRINSVAAAILSWYPAPNQNPANPSTSNQFAGNYGAPAPIANNYRNYLIKVDQNLGDTDTISLALRLWQVFGSSNGNGYPVENVNAAHPGENVAAYGAHFNNHYRDPSGTIGWTHTFNPHLVNAARAELLVTDQIDTTGPANGYNPSSLGLPAGYAAYSGTYFDRFPSVTFGSDGMSLLGSTAGLRRGDNEMVINDTVNWIHREHSVKAGINLQYEQYSQRSTNGNTGLQFSVGEGWTQAYDIVGTGGSASLAGSGNSIASLELGTLDNSSTSIATAVADNYYSQHFFAAFVQDDWKIRPYLTLNLGMRWENPGPGPVDRHNRQIYDFDSTDVNPISSLVNLTTLPVDSAILGGITFAGVNGNPRSPYAPIRDDFGPRAGFAYTYNSKTVLRGGIGVYYSNNGAGNSNAPAQTGFTSLTTYNGTNDGGVTPLQNLSNPFPVFQAVVGNCGGNQIQCLETSAGGTLSYSNPHFRVPIYLNSSFGVERQFTRHDTLEVSYAGVRSYNGTYTDNINHISAAAQAACDSERGGNALNCTQAYGSTPAPGTTVGYTPNPFVGLAPFAGNGADYTAPTLQKINLNVPYPEFGSISETNLPGTHFWYNALEATFNHRTAFGLNLHGTYTYSKAMTQGGYTDTINRIVTRQISGSDIPHRVTVSGVYLIPIGQGQKLFSGMNRFADLAFGGWQIGEIFLYQSGLPYSIGTGYEINSTNNGGYILPRKRFTPFQANPYWTNGHTNNYIQAFKPCVGTRNVTTGVVTLEAYSITAGCAGANFIQTTSYSQTPMIEYLGIRDQRQANLDLNISKNFKLVERWKMVLQLRLDAFNALNHPMWQSASYDSTVSDANFGTLQLGQATGQSNVPRQIQLNGRISW